MMARGAVAGALLGPATPYVAVLGFSDANQTEANVTLIAPIACTARNLRVNLTGTTVNRTVSFRRNGANTALACLVTSGSPTCTNGADTVAVSAGDLLVFEMSGTFQAGAYTALVSLVCQ